MRLNVHLPYGCGNKGKDDVPVMSILTFDINDTPEEDFLSRVSATIGVERGKSKLGWKTCDDKKKTPYHRLETHDDVKYAFAAHRKMLESKQRERPVYMEIANLVSKGASVSQRGLTLVIGKA
jgi:hypothetical protein